MEIKAKRMEKNLTMAEVARKAWITEGMYSLIESGKAHPSVKVAKRLAAVLDVHWTVFFKDVEPWPKEDDDGRKAAEA